MDKLQQEEAWEDLKDLEEQPELVSNWPAMETMILKTKN